MGCVVYYDCPVRMEIVEHGSLSTSGAIVATIVHRSDAVELELDARLFLFQSVGPGFGDPCGDGYSGVATDYSILSIISNHSVVAGAIWMLAAVCYLFQLSFLVGCFTRMTTGEVRFASNAS